MAPTRPRPTSAFVALVLLGLTGLAIAACSSTNAVTEGSVKCTPGNFVYCRCENRSEGTKLCHPDGVSFDPCRCDGTDEPFTGNTDGGLGDASLQPVDSGGPTTGPTIDAKCVGKLGVVAGAADDLDVYVAAYTGPGVFAVSKSHGPGLRGPATVLPVGTTLVATYLSRFSLLAWTKLAAGTWSSPNSIGAATSASSPSATLLNGQLRLFYLGTDGHFRTGIYSGTTGWDEATALAETTADAGAPTPGNSAPAAAVVGSSITLAFSGGDGALARETYSSGSWSAVTKFSGVSAYDAAPAVVALDPGGPKDLLMVYSGADLLMHVATREASNKVWNTSTLFDTAASSTEMALAALPGGKAMLVYRASNKQGYYSVWSLATGFGLPAELVAGKNPELASAPSMTRGQCGSDATLAYAQSDGLVRILRYTAGALNGPFEVAGIPRATFVGVGELP